jgi:hypothetical protein
MSDKIDPPINTLLRPFGARHEFYFTLYILHKERKNKRIARLFSFYLFLFFIQFYSSFIYFLFFIYLFFIYFLFIYFLFIFYLFIFYLFFIQVLYNNNNTNTIQIHYIMSIFASLTSLFGIGIGITIALIFL